MDVHTWLRRKSGAVVNVQDALVPEFHAGGQFLSSSGRFEGLISRDRKPQQFSL
jgi:hypothetical protein